MDKKDNKKNLSLYYQSISNEFDWKWKRMSHILGDSHYPSVGNYVESLLQNGISKFLPKQYSVGTGFVLFPSNNTHTVSKQLDIIIYNNNDTAPIYKDGNFVVVTPETVVAIIEVKSALSTQDIKSIITLYQDYCDKHLSYIKEWFIQQLKPPVFFSYSIKNEDKSPTLKSAITKLKKCFIEYIEKIESNMRENTNSVYPPFCIQNLFNPQLANEAPTFGGFYVYNEYVIIPKTLSIEGNESKGKISLCSLHGRNNDKADITFIHMVIRLLKHGEIPYNEATLSLDASKIQNHSEIRDIYNVSEMKIMY